MRYIGISIHIYSLCAHHEGSGGGGGRGLGGRFGMRGWHIPVHQDSLFITSLTYLHIFQMIFEKHTRS